MKTVKSHNLSHNLPLLHSFNTQLHYSYTLTLLHTSNLTLFQSYTLSILDPSNPTLFQSNTLPIIHFTNPILFQSNTLPISHSSNLRLFQCYTLPILHSSNLTMWILQPTTHNVDTRDPIGSKNVFNFQWKCLQKDRIERVNGYWAILKAASNFPLAYPLIERILLFCEIYIFYIYMLNYYKITPRPTPVKRVSSGNADCFCSGRDGKCSWRLKIW